MTPNRCAQQFSGLLAAGKLLPLRDRRPGNAKTNRQGIDRRNAILDFLRTHSGQYSFPPSYREIGEAVGLSSSSTVHNHVKTLQDMGLVRRTPNKPRCIELTEPPGPTEADRLRGILESVRDLGPTHYSRQVREILEAEVGPWE